MMQRAQIFWWWCCCQLLAVAGAQWTKPNAHLASFSDTYTVGERIILSWLALNDSSNDLWITRYDTASDTFALRLGTSIDLSQANSFDWTIAIDSDIVLADTRFILQFLPIGNAYNASTDPSLPSPAFNLILVNQAAPPNGTVGEPPTLPISRQTSITSSSTTPTSTSIVSSDESTTIAHPFLSNPAKVGIGVGVAGVTIVGAIAIGIWAEKRRRARRRMVSEQAEQAGPYEILGDKRLASEISSKELSVYELNNSREASVSEAGGSAIHEIATIVKKPGLHELPG